MGNLRIATWNVNGWTQCNAKIREQILLPEKFDIIAISETHCLDNKTLQPTLPEYKWIGHSRIGQHKNARRQFGGVGIFVSDSVASTYDINVVDCSHEGILGVILKHKRTDFQLLLFSCYLPPEDSAWGRSDTDFYGHLLSQIYYHNYVDCVAVCGDLNGRVGNMPDYLEGTDDVSPRTILDNSRNKHGSSLIEFLHESKLCITNGRITPELDNFTSVSTKGRAVVDYIAISQEYINMCDSCEVLLVNDLLEKHQIYALIGDKSKPPDHSIVSLSLCTMQSVTSETNGVNINCIQKPDVSRKRYYFNEIPHEFLNSERWQTVIDNLSDKIHNTTVTQNSIDENYSSMCENLFLEMDSHLRYSSSSAKTRKKFKNFKPYWDDELTQHWREMASAEKAWHRSKGTNSWNSLKDRFIYHRYAFDKKLRQAERAYNRTLALDIEDINTNNPKAFWEHISKLGPSKRKEIPLKVYDSDGHFQEDIASVKEKWKSDFSGLYNKPASDDNRYDQEFYSSILRENVHFHEHLNYQIEGDMDLPFSLDDLFKVQTKLKNNKAMGLDLIPNEILKLSRISVLLLEFFNMCFSTATVPSLWQQAIITPIPKSAGKDPYVPLNYRGISLLSCMYKMYSSLMNNRLNKYIDENNLVEDEQNGFRKDRSCVDHIFAVSSVIRNRLALKKHTFAAFVDFQKAFDWVDRDFLLYKLRVHYGISGRLYNAVRSVYSFASARIKLNNITTEAFSLSSGVKQGDNLSPTLFNLFLNDLATGIKRLNKGVDIDDMCLSILLYADDIVLLAPDENKLQSQLDYLYEWCRKWRMSVNISKSQIIHFRPLRCKRSDFTWTIGDQYLEIVSTYKYLGVYLHEHMDFTYTADILSTAASKALGFLRYKLRFLKECHYGTFTKLYTSCIVPILDYSSAVWGYKNVASHDNIQRRAIRYFLGLHRFAANDMIEGDMGWLPCNNRRLLAMANYWNRLTACDSHRTLYKIFKWSLKFVNYPSTWAWEMHSIFSESNHSACFDRLVQCDVNSLYDTLFDRRVQKWNSSRYDKPKLRYFNLYKSIYEPEDYVLSKSLTKRSRSLMAQFRASTLPLEIETGRYSGLALEQRLCKICNNGDIEDEIHFICFCRAYHDERIKLFDQAEHLNGQFCTLDYLDKFVFLMSDMQIQVAKFLNYAVSIRNGALYNDV